MEDQRAEEIWWQNEIRSGRDPSKVCGRPMDRDTAVPIFHTSCFQPTLKKELSDILVETTAQHFGIKSEEEKCNLKIMFDAYAQFKMRESFEKDQIELAETYSIELEAHHILKWSEYPRGRIDLKNGMCLCAKCHAKQHEGEPAERLILSKAGKRSGS